MRALAVMAALALGACAHKPQGTTSLETLRVQVPVMVRPPAAPLIVRPHLPLADLKPNASPDEVMRAYVATIRALTGYALELETILDTYKEETH